MAGRYLLTGTQLGMLKACLLKSENEEQNIGINLIDAIIDKQFLYNSESDILEDVESLTITNLFSR